MFKTIWFIVMAALCLNFGSKAQNSDHPEPLLPTVANFFKTLIDVTGRVVDERGEPLPGAKVKVNDVKNITASTNANREFTLWELRRMHQSQPFMVQ